MIGEYTSGKKSLDDARARFGTKALHVVLGQYDVCNCARSTYSNLANTHCYPPAMVQTRRRPRW